MKKYVGILLIAIVLTGCTQYLGNDQFNEMFNELDHSIMNEDWNLATKQMKNLTNYYENNLWKLQLISEEEEYKDLYETFSKLKIFIEEQDKTQSRVELGTAKSIIKHIYSL